MKTHRRLVASVMIASVLPDRANRPTATWDRLRFDRY
jgi:hypothetical protein